VTDAVELPQTTIAINVMTAIHCQQEGFALFRGANVVQLDLSPFAMSMQASNMLAPRHIAE
jgi:hypothetical protein